jgi:hypothetical protein
LYLHEQRQEADDALHVPAGLDALHDQRVGARLCRRARRIDRGDLHHDARAAGAGALDELRPNAPRDG